MFVLTEYITLPHIAVVKINKSQSLNALSSEILNELASTIEQFAEDDNVRVITFTGEGKAFVAGADISEMKDMSPEQANDYAMLCSEKYLKEKGLAGKAVVKGYGHRTAPLLFDKKIADNANSKYVLP